MDRTGCRDYWVLGALVACMGLSCAAAGGTVGALPLFFEQNQGQTNEQAGFLSRSHGYALYLQDTKNLLVVHPGASLPKGAAKARSPIVIETRYEGANAGARLRGVEPLPGRSNYFVGRDPNHWKRGIPHYGKVAVQDLYPGVDLLYYGNQGRVQYDFIVAPGADPSTIRMAFSGMQSLSIDAAGNLILDTAAGDLVQSAPEVYQIGPGGREAIRGAFALHHDGSVGFQVARYDARRPLIIDPILDFLADRPIFPRQRALPERQLQKAGFWSTLLGGSAHDGAHDVAVDADGNVYVAGFTTSVDLPAERARSAVPNAGTAYAFVAKFDADGEQLLYATYFGGILDQQAGHRLSLALGIDVDQEGQASVTGVTTAPDFPIVNALQSHIGGDSDAFVARLNADGNALLYSTFLGGGGSEWGRAIDLDAFGQAYVTGSTKSVDFPLKNPLQNSLGGDMDAFVSKLDEQGASLVYSTYLGGRTDIDPDASTAFPARDAGTGIAVDPYGQAHVTGGTTSADFPTTADAVQPNAPAAPATGSSAFVSKLSEAGDALEYSTYLGGGSEDTGLDIALDSQGNAHVAGVTASTDFPLREPAQPMIGGMTDGFVSKLSLAGDSLLYSTFLGGEDQDRANGIAVDKDGNAHVTGETRSARFPRRRAYQSSLRGNLDAFVTGYQSSGALRSSTYLGGTELDTGWGIAAAEDQIYVAGQTGSADFPTSANAFDTSFNGASDLFVTRFGPALKTPAPNNRFSFAASDYSVWEGQGSVELKVIRDGILILPASVDYASVSGSASAGHDFLSSVGTLTFAPGEANKTIRVSILTDIATEGAETFRMLLRQPTGGVALGDPNAATVTIRDGATPQ